MSGSQSNTDIADRKSGDIAVHQPPGVRYVEIAHSDDVEILEITLPAEFETEAVAAPEAITVGATGE